MSLHPASASSVPDDTAAVARAVFPQGTACLRLRDRDAAHYTLSKAVRNNGLRRSRYNGAAKTHLQQVLTAAGINLGRIAEWIADHKPA